MNLTNKPVPNKEGGVPLALRPRSNQVQKPDMDKKISVKQSDILYSIKVTAPKGSVILQKIEALSNSFTLLNSNVFNDFLAILNEDPQLIADLKEPEILKSYLDVCEDAENLLMVAPSDGRLQALIDKIKGLPPAASRIKMMIEDIVGVSYNGQLASIFELLLSAASQSETGSSVYIKCMPAKEPKEMDIFDISSTPEKGYLEIPLTATQKSNLKALNAFFAHFDQLDSLNKGQLFEKKIKMLKLLAATFDATEAGNTLAKVLKYFLQMIAGLVAAGLPVFDPQQKIAARKPSEVIGGEA